MLRSIIDSDYRCIICGINKNEGISLMENADLTTKKKNIIKHENLLSHEKVGKENSRFRVLEIEKKIFFFTVIKLTFFKRCRY